ncbi:hypothetical protein P4234_12070 [Pseudomonas aeruginosa]|nr:hypothetical protein [Pseudomonas aeruginosa]
MLHPSDSIVDWVLKTVPTMGAGWCPPGVLRHRHRRYRGEAAVMARRSSWTRSTSTN